MTYPAGSIVFNKGDPGACMYVVQAGVIEMVIGDKVVEVCTANKRSDSCPWWTAPALVDRARQGSVRAVGHRPAQVSLHGGRGAEFRDLHHGRDGAPHPRHEPMRHASCIENAAFRSGYCREGTQRKVSPMWPDRRIIDLFKIEHPIVLAPMAGAMDFELAVAGCKRGRPRIAALRDAQCRCRPRPEWDKFRAGTKAPVNLNFFCHTPPVLNNAREARWRERLKPYYRELGIDPAAPVPTSKRMPFDAAFCAMVEETKPGVVSFHFGLPEAGLFKRVKDAGCVVIVVRHHRRRGALARSARRRCGHRARLRGGRPSRHVPHRQPRRAGRHLCAGAAGRRRGESAGDRGRRHRRCARHRGRLRARRGRRADRHRLSALPGVEDLGAAPRGAQERGATTAPR